MCGRTILQQHFYIKKLRLIVLFGGPSGEHDVSMKSVRQVLNNLDAAKYDVAPVAITREGKWLSGLSAKNYLDTGTVSDERELIEGIIGDAKPDLAIIVGHGTFMEDGRLQALLEVYGVPYLFSGVLASSLAMDKARTKIIAKNAGLKIAKGIIIKKGTKAGLKALIKKLGAPVVVKPNALGSSVGAAIAKDEERLATAISDAFKWCDEVLLEQFIKGRELTVAVMGRRRPIALPVVEIKPKISEWFDYEAKYKVGGSEEICPAEIPDDIAMLAKKYAEKIFKAIGCRDLARADFIWNEVDGKLYFLEINTIPGMTETSLAPQAARAAGLDFPKFLDALIKGAV